MLKAIKNCEMPKETWTSFDIRVLYKANSFSEARLKLRRAEDDTDLQSEAEEGRPEKRKTRPNKCFLSSQESDEEPVKRKPILPKVPSIPPLPSLLRDAISSSDEISPPASQLASLQPIHALGTPEPSYHLPSQPSRHHGTPEPSYHLPSQPSRHHGPPEPSYHLPSQPSRHHGTPEPSYHLSPQPSRHHGTPEPFHLAPNAASEMDLQSALLREIIAKREVMCDMQRNLLRIVQDLHSTPTPHGHYMDGSFLPLRDAEALLSLDRDIKTKPEKRKDLVLTLGLAGGVNLKDTVWRVMKMLIQNDLACKMNWTGLHGKTSFQGLEVKNVVTAIRRNPGCRESTNQEVEQWLRRWLYLAGDREGGRRRRSTVLHHQPPTNTQRQPPTNTQLQAHTHQHTTSSAAHTPTHNVVRRTHTFHFGPFLAIHYRS
ncbi:uncharacterized protein LOC127635356 isoform X2 [Xyrauchen texanus]|uniref:uncharacterized protein LOC127635356 isoform X2 n=1 Tax=Xyrauchen texanus TaxID=154827 RepID=UPI002242BC26|nr:uncharacterized protein LOC127635356 isoform X2 [Xyrauchen texanus]